MSCRGLSATCGKAPVPWMLFLLTLYWTPPLHPVPVTVVHKPVQPRPKIALVFTVIRVPPHTHTHFLHQNVFIGRLGLVLWGHSPLWRPSNNFPFHHLWGRVFLVWAGSPVSSHSKLRMQEREKDKTSLSPLLGTCPGSHTRTSLSHPAVNKWPHLTARKAVFFLGSHPHLIKVEGSITSVEGENGYQGR